MSQPSNSGFSYWSGIKASLSPPLLSAYIFGFYLTFCLSVQALTGVWHGAFVADPDEPAHFLGAVMIRDWLASGRFSSPLEFARDYYDHYPFFAIGYWPPLFHIVTGILLLVAGVGRMQALLVPPAFAAGTGWLLYGLVQKRAGVVAGFCAGLLYLSLPHVQQLVCMVMVDHMTVFLTFATAVLLLFYLDQPNVRNGIFCAACCASAILTKYSAGYLLALPLLVALFLRRNELWRKLSFLMQPVLVGLIIGPWVVWTSRLARYGLPSESEGSNAQRIASFISETFQIFPPVLMALVILGLIALLLFPRVWAEDLVVLGVLCLGRLAFLIASRVSPEPRYLLVPAAALLVLSIAGWSAGFDRLRFRNSLGAAAAPITMVFLTVAFVVPYLGNFARPHEEPIQSVVKSIVENPKWAGRRVVVPTNLEGPVIAEFAIQDVHRPGYYLLRPSKILARSDWFGKNYSCFFRSPAKMLEYFQEQPVSLIIWNERPRATLLEHDRILGDMLRSNPASWRSASVGSPIHESSLWTIYEYSPLQSSSKLFVPQ